MLGVKQGFTVKVAPAPHSTAIIWTTDATASKVSSASMTHPGPAESSDS